MWQHDTFLRQCWQGFRLFEKVAPTTYNKVAIDLTISLGQLFKKMFCKLGPWLLVTNSHLKQKTKDGDDRNAVAEAVSFSSVGNLFRSLSLTTSRGDAYWLLKSNSAAVSFMVGVKKLVATEITARYIILSAVCRQNLFYTHLYSL